MSVRQTSCRYCGQDIEGISPFRRGEWRDRGNNWTCPTPEGDAGRVHAPQPEPQQPRPQGAITRDRYILTRMKKDPSVPARYRRSGWMAFDTQHKANGRVWLERADAEQDVEQLNRLYTRFVQETRP